MSREENLSSEGYRLICSLLDLQKLKKKRVTIDERVVVLFYVKGKVYAIDHFCYHTGGPLELGDIEDSHGRPCVVCPWHKHTITLDTGESLYTTIDPFSPAAKKQTASKGQKQRVHFVKVVQDQVYLKLSDPASSQLDSDRYFTPEYRHLIENVLEDPILQPRPPGPGVSVPIHSSRTDLPPPRR